MQLSVMRSECRQIIGQPDSNNSDFSESQLNTWANEFYRFAVVRLETVPLKERSYTTGTTVTLDGNTITVNRAKFLIQPENQWVELDIKDVDDLIRRDPDWENADTGKPEWMVKFTHSSGSQVVRLYPPPDANNTAQANGLKTYGLELPTSLSSDSDVPDLPYNIHDLFPHYMAYKCFLRLAQEERANNQLILVNSGLKSMRNISTKFSNSKGWTWTENDPGAVNWPW